LPMFEFNEETRLWGGRGEAALRRPLSRLRVRRAPTWRLGPGHRMVMLLTDETNIREVIAFPMNQQAQDLLMGAPAEVNPKRRRELYIRLDLPRPKKTGTSGES
jgi:aspartyl-tRNA synthetase